MDEVVERRHSRRRSAFTEESPPLPRFALRAGRAAPNLALAHLISRTARPRGRLLKVLRAGGSNIQHTTPSCGSALQPCNNLHVTLPYPSPVAPLHCAVLCRHHEYIRTWSACWPAFNRNQPGSFIQRRVHLSSASHGRTLAQ
jgi:hypothetical protein